MTARVSGFFLMIGLMLVAFAAGARADDPRAAGGMLAWPHDEMARAIGIFVPERMKALNVPGVSIAIVADGAITYSGTFGKADRGAGSPVTPSTLFRAGELGEAVAAYGAMTMVSDKLLFLDAPLARDLPQPWLTDRDDDRLVTLRQVLTNTSGLADNVAHPSRSTHFVPGSRFSHSGVGFLYLQHVMEAIEGEPFDAIMKARVFAPLDMRSSSYAVPAGGQAKMAQGYVPLGFPLTVFYIPFGVAFAIIFVILWAVSRFMLQRRVEAVDLLWPTLGGLGFTATIVWWGLGLEHGIYVAGISIACLIALVLLASVVYWLLFLIGLAHARDGVLTRGRARPEGLVVVIACVVALAGSLPALGWVVPVPHLPFLRGPERANAAASFQTTAQDMGRFMIGIMDGDTLGGETQARMLSERVPVAGPFAWALGLGVREDAGHETLWTRGSATGFESLMVMDPARRVGVVILTNSRAGGELAQDIARNVLGMEAVWSLP